MATYTAQPKKFMALCIIDILKKYSDADHRLNQKDIEDKLRTDYLMEVDRKSVKRNLVDLIDFGMNIEYDEIVRTVKNPRTGEMEENVSNNMVIGKISFLFPTINLAAFCIYYT